MENELSFKTKDFYHASCLRASGATLLGLQKETAKFVLFVFALSPFQAEEIIRKHWSRELVLPTRDIIDAIRELKQRIHSGI